MEREINLNFSLTNSLSVLLTVAFVVLKLCDVINWSWFLVFLPLIINIGIVVLVFVILMIIYLVQYYR